MDPATRAFDEVMLVSQKRKKLRRGRDIDARHNHPYVAVTDVKLQDIEAAYNSIFDGFVRLGDTMSGERYIGDIESNGNEPTVVTYTTLINAYGKELDNSSVRRVIQRMQHEGIAPDRGAMSAFLSACVR